MMSLTYAIIENGQPMNGEHLSYSELMRSLPHAGYDAEVIAWDYAEALRDKATPLRLVTEDVTIDWWDNHYGCAEAMAWIEAGKDAPGLAMRFYHDECAVHEARVEAA